ncbi:MAG: TfoX/Sxy family protein [Nodosilinea sp.]
MATAKNNPFKDGVVSHLNRVAPVTARAMFGGYGLYVEGVMFALIAYDVLYFKADDENRDDYLDAGTGPFIYHRSGKAIEMSYYQLPDAVYDDLGTLHQWVEKAVAAARRAKRGKPPFPRFKDQ